MFKFVAICCLSIVMCGHQKDMSPGAYHVAVTVKSRIGGDPVIDTKIEALRLTDSVVVATARSDSSGIAQFYLKRGKYEFAPPRKSGYTGGVIVQIDSSLQIQLLLMEVLRNQPH